MTRRRILTVSFLVAFFSRSTATQTPPAGASGFQVRIGVEQPGGGRTIVALPLETYVARVLTGEAARNSPPAALEALAITIRTFAIANRGRHQADGFDLCDQTHCQVMRQTTPPTERAAQATSGLILTQNGTAASVFYSASCGGRTEIPSNVWPGADDPPFLPSQDDDGCGGSPAWTTEISAGDLTRALRSVGFRGDTVRDVRVLARNASGRVARLKIDGLRPNEITGQDLRMAVGRTLGWQFVKSTAFDVQSRGGMFQFAGRGSGHGVGLCVIGSVGLADRGSSATAILGRYFPGLSVASLEPRLIPATEQLPRAVKAPAAVAPPPADLAGVFVALPEGDEGEQVAISRLAARARDDLAKVLAVTPPARVTLRFHATTQEFERATGRPWFTSGAVLAGDVHLLPLAILRAQDTLERTLRRELVHAMTDGELAKRPVWVREGAASYFAGELAMSDDPPQPSRFVRPKPRASCPSDNDLLHPLSVGALSNASAQARACFARQLAAGKTWRDVR